MRLCDFFVVCLFERQSREFGRMQEAIEFAEILRRLGSFLFFACQTNQRAQLLNVDIRVRRDVFG